MHNKANFVSDECNKPCSAQPCPPPPLCHVEVLLDHTNVTLPPNKRLAKGTQLRHICLWTKWFTDQYIVQESNKQGSPITKTPAATIPPMTPTDSPAGGAGITAVALFIG